jgi:transposase
MRHIKEVLRLKFESKLSHENIAAAIGLSGTTVTDYVRRAVHRGLSWPLPDDLDDARLEALLFKHAASRNDYALPDFAHIHLELKRQGITLRLLWNTYRGMHGARAYRYNQFIERYRLYRQTLPRSMRQVHRAGEKLFIDYCSKCVPVADARSGENRNAQIFVAVLGASKYTYAEATWTRGLQDWIDSHMRAFEYFGSVPRLLVPFGTRSSINAATRYELEQSASYADLAGHYATQILGPRYLPAHAEGSPEMSILVAQRWIHARLRGRSFLSLAALNRVIGELLENLNHRAFKRPAGSRASVFTSIDRPTMKPLPASRYEFAEWVIVHAGVDNHVEVAGHHYSVPPALRRLNVLARLTATSLECFFKGRLVAVHVRSRQGGHYTTAPEHLPKSRRRHL